MGNHKNIRCADCAFVGVDNAYSKKGWTAYECRNPKSENYRALLNVSNSGTKLPLIACSGCSEGTVTQ